MISKELLSGVLKRDVYKVKDVESNTLIYGCVHSDGWYDEINIYELAHKCKEWALSKSILELVSAMTEEGAYCQIDNIVPSTIEYDINQIDTSYRTVFDSIIFDADTEPEAIFKACEWILKEKK